MDVSRLLFEQLFRMDESPSVVGKIHSSFC